MKTLPKLQQVLKSTTFSPRQGLSRQGWRCVAQGLVGCACLMGAGQVSAQFGAAEAAAIVGAVNGTTASVNGTTAAVNGTTAAVNSGVGVLDTTLNTQFNTQFGYLFTNYLTPLNLYVQTLIAQGIVSPTMASTVLASITTATTALGGWVTSTQAAVGTPDVLGLPAGITANTGDPRFYTTAALGGASSCVSDPSAVGVLLTAKCTELQGLRTYRALHSSAYQIATSGIATALGTLAAFPPVNIADVHAKNQGINTLKALQQQMAELYRSQQDYLQARIEVVAEVRQALANKKNGKSRPGGLLSVALGTAAKAIFATARTATP